MKNVIGLIVSKVNCIWKSPNDYLDKARNAGSDNGKAVVSSLIVIGLKKGRSALRLRLSSAIDITPKERNININASKNQEYTITPRIILRTIYNNWSINTAVTHFGSSLKQKTGQCPARRCETFAASSTVPSMSRYISLPEPWKGFGTSPRFM